MYSIDEQDYLAHHGIKGMKWGVRRFQNEDGSLTDAGKRRLGTLRSESEKWSNKSKELHSSAKKNFTSGHLIKAYKDRSKAIGAEEYSSSVAKKADKLESSSEKAMKKYQRIQNAKARKEINKDRREANKNRALLSDDELNERVARLQKEQQLNNLTEQNVGRGRKWLNRTEEQIGTNSVQKLIVEGTVGAVAAVGASYLKDYLTNR